MATKYNDTLLRQAYQVWVLKGDLTGFARAKGVSRSTLYTKLTAWRVARGL
jgi:transcriptional regulator of acetoin/glycerol metabolism